MSGRRWRHSEGVSDSAVHSLGEYDLSGFPEELRGLAETLAGKPDAVGVRITYRDGNQEMLQLEDEPVPIGEGWRSHWRKDPRTAAEREDDARRSEVARQAAVEYLADALGGVMQEAAAKAGEDAVCRAAAEAARAVGPGEAVWVEESSELTRERFDMLTSRVNGPLNLRHQIAAKSKAESGQK